MEIIIFSSLGDLSKPFWLWESLSWKNTFSHFRNLKLTFDYEKMKLEVEKIIRKLRIFHSYKKKTSIELNDNIADIQVLYSNQLYTRWHSQRYTAPS